MATQKQEIKESLTTIYLQNAMVIGQSPSRRVDHFQYGSVKDFSLRFRACRDAIYRANFAKGSIPVARFASLQGFLFIELSYP
jgi:hypothetical protein